MRGILKNIHHLKCVLKNKYMSDKNKMHFFLKCYCRLTMNKPILSGSTALKS